MGILKALFRRNKIQETVITNDTNIIKSQNIKSDATTDTELEKIYGMTIFLYTQDKHELRNNDEYPKYLLYDFGITNSRNMHIRMIETGYLHKAEIYDVLSSYKLPELKSILESMDLKKTGKKDDLIKRIAINLDNDKKDELISKSKTYVLSEKGIEFLHSTNDYVLLFKHKNYDISVEDFIKAKNNLNFDAKFNDVVWSIFNNRTCSYISTHEYGMLRNTYLNMAHLLEEEKKFNQSLHFYLMVLYNDSSGIDNINTISGIKEKWFSKKEAIDLYIDVFFAPGIISKIVDFQKYYSECMLDEILQQTKLPFNCCSNELFIKLVNEVYTKEFIDEKYYIKKIRAEYIKLIRSL